MRSSGYEVRTGCPDASAGASLKLRDVTNRLPGNAESERGRQTSGQRFGGQREPSGSQQMIFPIGIGWSFPEAERRDKQAARQRRIRKGPANKWPAIWRATGTERESANDIAETGCGKMRR